jgi:hypothetical protein
MKLYGAASASKTATDTVGAAKMSKSKAAASKRLKYSPLLVCFHN